MLLVLPLLAGLVVGMLLGGSFKHLTAISIRLVWLFLLGLGLQLVLFTPLTDKQQWDLKYGNVLYVVSLLLVLSALLLNSPLVGRLDSALAVVRSRIFHSVSLRAAADSIELGRTGIGSRGENGKATHSNSKIGTLRWPVLLMALGACMNLLVIVANGGMMPVDTHLLSQAAGQQLVSNLIHHRFAINVTPINGATVFPFLGDRFHVTIGVYSVGDMTLGLGVFLLAILQMRPVGLAARRHLPRIRKQTSATQAA